MARNRGSRQLGEQCFGVCQIGGVEPFGEPTVNRREKIDCFRPPAQWLAFIGAKPGMKILDIFAVYGWKAELLARAVAPGGTVYAQNSEAAFTRVKDRLEARLKTSAAANMVSAVRPFEDPAPTGMHD